MFTGIVKEVAKSALISKKGPLYQLAVNSLGLWRSAAISDSVAVNGICLTLVEKKKEKLFFDVAAPTYLETNLRFFKNNSFVNLEPALEVGQKLGGHFVLGHVDTVLQIKKITNKKGYWEFEIICSNKNYIVEKGSIALEGISLTIKKIFAKSFTLDIVPFTYKQTNLKYKKPGNWLNVEFDYLLKGIKK